MPRKSFIPMLDFMEVVTDPHKQDEILLTWSDLDHLFHDYPTDAEIDDMIAQAHMEDLYDR